LRGVDPVSRDRAVERAGERVQARNVVVDQLALV
jgi:hypothetical protein